MFEELSLINLGEQKDELPQLIRIGNFQRKSINVPILLPIDVMNGLCFQTDSSTHKAALGQMQYMALSLLKQVSPELIHITCIDMGLNTDFPLLYSLKNSNISFVTDKAALKKELERLFIKARHISSHCLGGEYANLKEYNRTASYKEVYDFIFISNFPKDFGEEEICAICDVINDGAKCGIQVIVDYDKHYFDNTRHYGNNVILAKLRNLEREITYIDCTRTQAMVKNLNLKIMEDWFRRFPFTFETYPIEVLKPFIESLNKVEIKKDSGVRNFLSVPIGRCGRDTFFFEMGQKAEAYHGLIGGQSGTGKSTLLNNIITSIAEQYSPDEMRLYLLDYKLGVEFKIYQHHPNVELLLLDNERLSVAVEALKSLETEMKRREKLFEIDLTIQDIDSYNKIAEVKLPRILIIIDEVQQLFKDHETRRQIGPLIKRIAKQGRSFGIHMLFSSQSYDGCDIGYDTLAQMSLRIAFKLANGAECRAILGRDNDEPLGIPNYTAVYNPNNGNREWNSIVRLDNFERERILSTLQSAAEKHKGYTPFEKRIITRDTPTNEQELETSGRTASSSKIEITGIKRNIKTTDDEKWL